jgi:hemin uptake protein HemP
MTQTEPGKSPNALQNNTDSTREPRKVSSADLMQGATEVLITHRDHIYRLRITRSGKLILHK